MKKNLKTTLISSLAAIALLPLSSCVNEWPHPEYRTYDVTLLIHTETDWLPDYDMTYTRANDAVQVVYLIKIYEGGTISNPIKEFTIYSYDLSRKDFTIDLSLNPGDYDVYVWSDLCGANGESLYYNTSDFSAITYLTPYEGDSNNKDAFRGQHSFTIDDTIYLKPTATEVVNLSRPLARYIFIATDLEEFIDSELSRGNMRGLSTREHSDISTRDLEEELEGYSIRIVYPLYLPAVFNVFTDEPYDSWTGISYEGSIQPLSMSEASLGLDYLMIGNDPSSVQVALEIYGNSGDKIGGTRTLNIPIERNRTTLIYGKFLTSQEDAGVSINPDFDGQYNIEYRP